ncbi:MAG: preprotein translocase subunit YajC [bacterium]
MFNTFAAMFAMAPGGQGGTGSLVSTLIMFGAVILIMYFLMIRPQQKRQKEHQKMLESIKKGDKVITSAGMHGTVVDIDGSNYVIQVADNVKITFEKSSIATKKS